MLDFNLDANYKQVRFFKTLLKKDFKFVWSRKNNTIIYNISLVLLLTKIDLILKKPGYRKQILVACDFSFFEIVIIPVIKVVIFYIKTFIV